MTFKPLDSERIYAFGEKVGWTVTGGTAAFGGYTYTVKKNNMDVMKTGHFNLSSEGATIEATSDGPAMLYVQVTSDQSSNPSQAELEHLNAALKVCWRRPIRPRRRFWTVIRT